MDSKYIEFFFLENQYNKMNVPFPNSSVFYKQEQNRMRIILFILEKPNLPTQKEELEIEKMQITALFQKKGYSNISFLTINCTEKVDRAREIAAMGNTYWILTSDLSSLIVYENKDNNFSDLENELEKWLENLEYYYPRYEEYKKNLRLQTSPSQVASHLRASSMSGHK